MTNNVHRDHLRLYEVKEVIRFMCHNQVPYYVYFFTVWVHVINMFVKILSPKDLLGPLDPVPYISPLDRDASLNTFDFKLIVI